MQLKFRVIQSNDRGLITKQGDRTYARRGPAKGEEALELPTLFIWLAAKTVTSPAAGPSGQASGLRMTSFTSSAVFGM